MTLLTRERLQVVYVCVQALFVTYKQSLNTLVSDGYQRPRQMGNSDCYPSIAPHIVHIPGRVHQLFVSREKCGRRHWKSRCFYQQKLGLITGP